MVFTRLKCWQHRLNNALLWTLSLWTASAEGMQLMQLPLQCLFTNIYGETLRADSLTLPTPPNQKEHELAANGWLLEANMGWWLATPVPASSLGTSDQGDMLLPWRLGTYQSYGGQLVICLLQPGPKWGVYPFNPDVVLFDPHSVDGGRSWAAKQLQPGQAPLEYYLSPLMTSKPTLNSRLQSAFTVWLYGVIRTECLTLTCYALSSCKA